MGLTFVEPISTNKLLEYNNLVSTYIYIMLSVHHCDPKVTSYYCQVRCVLAAGTIKIGFKWSKL